MAALNSDDSVPNPSKEASTHLDAALQRRAVKKDKSIVYNDEIKQLLVGIDEPGEERSTVEAELKAPRLIPDTSERKKIRVLMISRDRNIFVNGSSVQRRIAEYGKLFEELHIIVFSLDEYEFRGMQLADNVWAYPTNSRSRWLYAYDAYRTAARELHFAQSLRADVITAQDPFEAGIAAYAIAKRFGRRLHIQIHTDLYEPYFVEQDEFNTYRRWIAWFLFPRADRVRAVSEDLAGEIVRRHPELVGKVDVLPIFVDLVEWSDITPTYDLHEKYPQFNFIMLMASRFAPEKRIDLAIEASQFVLRQYATVGLVIVGQGPLEKALKDKVAKMGLSEKVVFEPWQDDIRSHFKTAEIFLNTSSYEGYGLTLVEAAAAGLPVITTPVGVARTLFVNDESGIICEIGDLGCVIKGITKYLNDNSFRTLAAENAKTRVFALVEANIGMYHRRFRESIESSLSDVSGEAASVATEEGEPNGADGSLNESAPR